MCSSSLISDEWRQDIAAHLATDASEYLQADYRRFFPAHLQFLAELCHVSIRSVSNSVDQFTSSLLATSQLLSKSAFQKRIDSLITEAQLNAPETLSHCLSLLRNTNHENTIESASETNCQYFVA